MGRVCGFGVQSVFPHRALCLSPSQLASVILKQYVETHWCAQSERFRPPETTERVRTAHDPRLWVRGAGSGYRRSPTFSGSAVQLGDARARRVTVAGVTGSGAAGWPVTCQVCRPRAVTRRGAACLLHFLSI